MAGLVPAIHVLSHGKKDADPGTRPGMTTHWRNQRRPYSVARLAALANFFSTRSRFSFDR
jgi:hypothetical protein